MLKYCKECKEYTKHEQCQFIGHIKCSVCGFCNGCSEHDQEVKKYNRTINDPEYYFEPWDWSDTPENRVPKSPKKRLKVFPSGEIEIVDISPVIVIEGEKSNFYKFNIKFNYPTHQKVAAYAGFAGTETKIESIYYKPGITEKANYLGAGNSLWESFENIFTKDAMEKWLDSMTERFKAEIK
ncbi:hypothetical protein [Ruminiclostridium cellobioparum]|uniref:hypothetical protein n=1 Tax=Ruminiclostridium cellobioparum TaxID=29355 RepID=UPI0028B0194C|nr:hypothetical protein [Ruminiclostridium cellobioparum]